MGTLYDTCRSGESRDNERKMIRYKCNKCGANLETDDTLSGQMETCPACQESQTVPQSRRKNMFWVFWGIVSLAAIVFAGVMDRVLSTNNDPAALRLVGFIIRCFGFCIAAACFPAVVRIARGWSSTPRWKRAVERERKIHAIEREIQAQVNAKKHPPLRMVYTCARCGARCKSYRNLSTILKYLCPVCKHETRILQARVPGVISPSPGPKIAIYCPLCNDGFDAERPKTYPKRNYCPTCGECIEVTYEMMHSAEGAWKKSRVFPGS